MLNNQQSTAPDGALHGIALPELENFAYNFSKYLQELTLKDNSKMKTTTVIVTTIKKPHSGWWETVATVNGLFFSSCTRPKKQHTIDQIVQDLKECGIDYYPKHKAQAPVMSIRGTFSDIASQLKAA